MTTKDEGSQQKGLDRRRFAASTGAPLGMLVNWAAGVEPGVGRGPGEGRRWRGAGDGIGINQQSVT